MVFKRESDTVFPCDHPRAGNTTKEGRCRRCRNAYARLKWRANPVTREATHCAQGHEFTPENTRIIKGSRKGTRKWCLKCEGMRTKQRQKAVVPKRVDVPDNKYPCRHDRTPVNTVVISGRNQCRICRNVYYKEYMRKKRLNIPHVYANSYGLSLAEKIRRYTLGPNEHGCKLWTGPMERGRPQLEIKKAGVKTIQWSPKIIWEKHTGKKLREKHMVVQTCGNRACTTAKHLAEKWMGDVLHTKEAHAKTRAKMRPRIHKDRDAYVTEAYESIREIRKVVRANKRWLPDDIVDEIAQEILLEVHLAWTRGVVIEAMKGWVITAAKMRTVDRLRYEHKRLCTSLDEDIPKNEFESTPLVELIPAPHDADPAVWLEEEESRQLKHSRLIADMGRHLPEKMRRVFHLQTYETLSQKEIARAMGITENTVEVHLQKARRRVLRERRKIRLREIV